MSQALINLTLAGVNQAIEDVLDEYPVHPYQSAFSMPELRQKLIAHILGQAPQPCGIDGNQELSNPAQDCHFSRLQARLRTEMLIRGSILYVLRENADWINRHLSDV